MATFEYKVIELREGFIGSRVTDERLQKILNGHGELGWQLKSITALDHKARLGPGSTTALMVTFERQFAAGEN